MVRTAYVMIMIRGETAFMVLKGIGCQVNSQAEYLCLRTLYRIAESFEKTSMTGAVE